MAMSRQNVGAACPKGFPSPAAVRKGYIEPKTKFLLSRLCSKKN